MRVKEKLRVVLDYEKERRKIDARAPKRIVNFLGEEKTEIIFFLSCILSTKCRRKVLVIDNTRKDILRMIVGVDEQNGVSRRKSIVYKLDGSDFDLLMLEEYDIILNLVGYNMDFDREYMKSIYSYNIVVTNMQKDAVCRCKKVIQSLGYEMDLVVDGCVDGGVSIGNVLVDLRYKFNKKVKKCFYLLYDINTYREFIKLQYGQKVEWGSLSPDMVELLSYMINITRSEKNRMNSK